MTDAPASLLVVDDDEMAREMLRRRLERQGFAVASADRGRTGIEWIERNRVDVVLLDIDMPEMNGIDVLQLLRRRYSPTELPIIMVTANNETETIVAALNSGANDYVTKPVDFPVVLARIGAQLSRKRAEEALRESEERYAVAAMGSNAGLWDWNLKRNTVYYSPRWKAMLGCEDGEIGDAPDEWFARVHPQDLARVRADIQRHLEGGSTAFETEYRLLHRDGSYRWILTRGVAIRNGSGVPIRMAGSQSDVTEGKVADPLTGLANRLLFVDRLTQALHRKKRRPDRHFAVMFLDLDRFKDVNDGLGHMVGDELLVAAAQRLETCLRVTDSLGRFGRDTTIARFGGDEFTVLLEDMKHQGDAILVAERLQKEVSRRFDVAGHEVFMTASIGIVSDTTGYENPEDLLRDADTAMYRAKATGRARFEVFDAQMRETAVQRLQTGNDLQRAVDRCELKTYYQPIVSLASGRIAGFEVLVRWPHATRGMIMPDHFIGVAEETGLILRIGEWVLGEACRQVSAWQRAYPGDPPLTICVNLSARQFVQPTLVPQVTRFLDETGLPAHCLKLEITESLVVDQRDATMEQLRQLRELGVHLCIDDFGTGYSSLSRLHAFPVTTLKVDRSFVGRIGAGGENLEIVRTIVGLAHTLGLEVIAEGIETEDQLSHLRALGCEFAQGFYFARALAPAEAEAVLRTNPRW
jgi:diguanylate cyclase (GGDEF)-like protein/PAS domain S-box-containing protein